MNLLLPNNLTKRTDFFFNTLLYKELHEQKQLSLMCAENSGSVYEKVYSIEKVKEELRNGSRLIELEET